MLLTVDIGNSQVSLGLFVGDSLVRSGGFPTISASTGEEARRRLQAFWEGEGRAPDRPSGAAIASVVPAATAHVVAAIEEGLAIKPLVVVPGRTPGMPVNYQPPERLGADRWVNAMAAYQQLRACLIVVDLGTATTFDCVSASGEHVGGAICLGIGGMASALEGSTARLPAADRAPASEAIATTTLGGMRAGLYFGYGALVDGMVRRMARELGATPRVVATGGWAPWVAPVATTIQEVDPHLTLKGLRLWHGLAWRQSESRIKLALTRGGVSSS